jgi:hypothetical protein
MAKEITKHSNTYMGFRPRIENEPDWYWLKRWCEANGTTLSAIINNLIPYLKVAAENTTEKHASTVTIDASFGRIKIK